MYVHINVGGRPCQQLSTRERLLRWVFTWGTDSPVTDQGFGAPVRPPPTIVRSRMTCYPSSARRILPKKLLKVRSFRTTYLPLLSVGKRRDQSGRSKRRKRESPANRGFSGAAGPGFEPGLTDPEIESAISIEYRRVPKTRINKPNSPI
jgi:hypothetical protein